MTDDGRGLCVSLSTRMPEGYYKGWTMSTQTRLLSLVSYAARMMLLMGMLS